MLFKSILTASLAILSSALFAEARKSKTHDVIVGGAAGLVYTPNQVYADPGDKVKFHFQFKNHTVTQSSFDEPCEPLKGGFDSGFMPVGMDVKRGPTFTIKVKDYDPIWVHCEQIDHCPSGMVFAVNAPKKGNTFKKFLKKAKESGKDNYHDGGSYKRSDEGAEENIEEKRGLGSALPASVTLDEPKPTTSGRKRGLGSPLPASATIGKPKPTTSGRKRGLGTPLPASATIGKPKPTTSKRK